MLRLAAPRPDTAVRLPPGFRRLLHLPAHDWPHSFRELVARARVQVGRVEHRPPNVVLYVLVSGVPDTDRPRSVVAGQVGKDPLLEVALARHPIDVAERPVA